MDKLIIPGSRNFARQRRKELLAQAEADAAAKFETKADPFVQAFIAMTPAEVEAYIDSHMTDLASSRALMKKVALMLLLLARKEYRDE